MKKPTKSNKGITLITLVITVIVIAILASVATYSGIEVINSSKLTRFTTEMKLIQTKVNEIYDSRTKYEEIGDSNYKEGLSTILGLLDSEWGYGVDISSYKYYNTTDLKNGLGIEDVEQSVFINLEKRKVISSKGITVDGETYHVLEQLPNNLYNVEYEQPTAEKFGINFVFGETDANEKLYEGDKLQFTVELGEEAIKAHSKVTKIYGEEITILSNEDIIQNEKHEFNVEKNVKYQVEVTIKDINNIIINKKILTITMNPYLETEDGITEKNNIEGDLAKSIDKIKISIKEERTQLEKERENYILEIKNEMRKCDEERDTQIKVANNNEAIKINQIEEDYAATINNINNLLNTGTITKQQANSRIAEADEKRQVALASAENEKVEIIEAANKQYNTKMQELEERIVIINKSIDEEINNLEEAGQEEINNLKNEASEKLKVLEKYILVIKNVE